MAPCARSQFCSLSKFVHCSGPSGRTTLLPDPMAALSAVRHKPGYLDPEATRPLAAPIHSTRPAAPVRPPEPTGDGSGAGGGEKRKAEWDISMMAPPLKGQAAPEKRGVISAAAKLNRPDREDDGIVTAAQVRAGRSPFVMFWGLGLTSSPSGWRIIV
jgi:hypothetical protein